MTETSHKLKILIVDDSVIVQSLISRALSEHPQIQVIGHVENGAKVMEILKKDPKNAPDIITLDIEMPIMDGLETLQAIQELNKKRAKPINVIMASSLTKRGADITMKALEMGAFDFVTKPVTNSPAEAVEVYKNELIPRLIAFGEQNKLLPKTGSQPHPQAERIIAPKDERAPSTTPPNFQAVVFGVSTGGPKALLSMLPELTQLVEIPILIVQHMPPNFTQTLAQHLASKCSSEVLEAQDDMLLAPKCVYIAPGGKHMLLRKTGVDHSVVHVGLSDSPPDGGFKPAVNVLFRSAANILGPEVIAVVLTGMGNDGLKGVEVLKRTGAHVIVQDEASSVVWGMPGSIVAAGYENEVLPLMDIPGAIAKLIKR